MAKYTILQEAVNPTFPCPGGTGCKDANGQWVPCVYCYGLGSQTQGGPCKGFSQKCRNATGEGEVETKKPYAMYVGGGAVAGALLLVGVSMITKKKLAGKMNWLVGAAIGAGVGYYAMPKA